MYSGAVAMKIMGFLKSNHMLRDWCFHRKIYISIKAFCKAWRLWLSTHPRGLGLCELCTSVGAKRSVKSDCWCWTWQDISVHFIPNGCCENLENLNSRKHPGFSRIRTFLGIYTPWPTSTAVCRFEAHSVHSHQISVLFIPLLIKPLLLFNNFWIFEANSAYKYTSHEFILQNSGHHTAYLELFWGLYVSVCRARWQRCTLITQGPAWSNNLLQLF